jgi:hypothetical protein
MGHHLVYQGHYFVFPCNTSVKDELLCRKHQVRQGDSALVDKEVGQLAMDQ